MLSYSSQCYAHMVAYLLIHCSLFITLHCDVVRRVPSVRVHKPLKQINLLHSSHKALLDNLFLTH